MLTELLSEEHPEIISRDAAKRLNLPSFFAFIAFLSIGT